MRAFTQCQCLHHSRVTFGLIRVSDIIDAASIMDDNLGGSETGSVHINVAVSFAKLICVKVT